MRSDLTGDGNFQRTLWHEIGHYLGVDRDRQGRTLDVALEDYADAIEEMKADLVSLFAAQRAASAESRHGGRAARGAGLRHPARDAQHQAATESAVPDACSWRSSTGSSIKGC